MTSRDVLYLLSDNKAHLTRELADKMMCSRDSMAAMCRCLKKRGMIISIEGIHSITASGLDVLSDKQEPCKGKAKQSKSGLRHRAWKAMHILTLFNVSSLLEVVATGEEKGGEENLRNYLSALHKAGILVKNRSGKYLLKESAKGPHAPSYNREKKTVTDRSTGEVFYV
ncbi:MAG: hypothetical protein RRY29_11415 [Desulfovibrionaceae bacterium]